jgi:DnaK suppressor protein
MAILGPFRQLMPGVLLGEDNMKKADMKVYSSMPIHMAELGSDNFEQEFTLSLLANEEDRLGMIENALQRIEGGEFGQCEQCDGVIPKTRLNAIPYTPVCVKCAESRDIHGVPAD